MGFAGILLIATGIVSMVGAVDPVATGCVTVAVGVVTVLAGINDYLKPGEDTPPGFRVHDFGTSE